MKLQHLAVFVSAVIIAGTTSAAEVYNKNGNKLDFFGKVSGIRHIASENDKNGDRSFATLGFGGETQLGDELIGFGTWEHAIVTRHTENQNVQDKFTLLGVAGLKFGDIGSIDYGRNYGVLYHVNSWTDVMPAFGGDTSVADNFLSGMANGTFTYRNTNFFGIIDGLNFALQYQGKNDVKKNNDNGLLKEANGDGYGMSMSYELGNGISAGAAYTNSRHTFEQRSMQINSVKDKSKNAEAYSLGLKYDANKVYMAALYSETRNMTPVKEFIDADANTNNDGSVRFSEKAKNIEFVGQYEFDCGFRPSLGYLQSKIDGDNERKRQDIKKYIEIGAIYNFNDNMLAFLDYRINLLSKNSFTEAAAKFSSSNIVALGMTYMF